LRNNRLERAAIHSRNIQPGGRIIPAHRATSPKRESEVPMKTNLMKSAAVLGVVVTLAAAAPGAAIAAPFKAGHGEAVKSATPSDTVEVRRWYRRGGFWAGAAVGGLVLGSALAAPYYYNRPYYDGYYAYGPAQKCWYQTGPYRGQGYYGYC
jgi:hypothetical protein